MQGLRVDPDRLWRSLMALAKFGATPKGGVRRLTLTETDGQARDQFVAWAREAGLEVRVDAIGNIFARRAGTDPAAAAVAMGSHLDSQPSGGKFDGAYGVMAGLEVMRTLNDAGIVTRAPLEVVSWTNEEGSRYTPVMMGSGVVAGVHTLEHCLAQRDLDGVSVGQALERIGYAGGAQPQPIGAYVEAHIEQGPVLEAAGITIGVVLGALGQRWFDAVITGQDAHAGPTPMERRQDALVAASRLVLAVNRIAREHPDDARGTVGFMQVKPNSRNVVPGEVRMSVEFRNAKDETLKTMVGELREECEDISRSCNVRIALDEIVYFPPCEFDRAMVGQVREAARALGLAHRDIVSGAGHDAVYIARVAPTAMIFVPCEGGLSHNELENATPQDLAAGAGVLLHAALARAGVARTKETVP
jgi:N-carbamoyl-L-amino-acid hydrolase